MLDSRSSSRCEEVVSPTQQRQGKPLSVRKSRRVSQIAGPHPWLPLGGPEFMSCGRLLFSSFISLPLYYFSVHFFGRGFGQEEAPQILGWI